MIREELAVMSKKTDDVKVQQDGGVTLEVEITGSEDVPIVFANNIFVRHEEDMFLITFAQAHGPYIANPTPEQLKKIGKVPSQIVARIAVSPTRMKEFLNVLNGNFERFMKKRTGSV
jgi:hypothetical protein